ncbi:MAG: hypothetical protein ACI9OJ_000557 [Myxococcota bacterium]
MEASRHAATLVVVAGVITAFAGCPQKLTQEVVREVPKECPPAPAPTVEKPPVAELVTVAVVRSKAGPRAVVGTAGYAAVVANGDAIGKEPALVKRITPDGVNVQMADGTLLLLPLSEDLEARAIVGDGTDAPDGTGAGTVAEPSRELSDLALWRTSVIHGVARGYGIPVDVPWALTLAMMPHEPPQVASALRSLGWSPTQSISKATLGRIEVRNGAVTAVGWSPNKTVLDTIVARLKTANPLIGSVKVQSQVPEDGGLKFSLLLTGPMVSARDIAQEGAPAAEGTWPPALLSKLEAAAKTLPKNAALGGVEDDIKTLATRYSLTVGKMSRLPTTVEEGYLGMASFDLEVSGDIHALLGFLGALRTAGASGRPVAIDPLVIVGNKAQATIRVPYVTSKVDARTPAPNALLLPAMTNNRWRAARSLPLPTLRDPFKK